MLWADRPLECGRVFGSKDVSEGTDLEGGVQGARPPNPGRRCVRGGGRPSTSTGLPIWVTYLTAWLPASPMAFRGALPE